MILAGFVSFIQYYFIFSLILLVLWEKLSLFHLLLTIPFNFLVNFFLLFFLTAIGYCTPSVLWSVFTFEVLLLGAVLFIKRGRGERSPFLGFKITPLFVLAFANTLYYLVRFKTTWGEIFYSCDSIMSWHRWALDWAQNRFPLRTYDYPQLNSALLSLGHLFTGNSDLHLYSAAGSHFIIALVALLPFSWGIQEKAFRPFAFILTLLLPYMGTRIAGLWNVGYADGPLLYMGLILAILLMKWDRLQKEPLCPSGVSEAFFILFVATMTMSSAILLKWNGLYLMASFVVLALILNRHRRYRSMIVPSLILTLILVLPWVLFQFFNDPSRGGMAQVIYNATPGHFWDRPWSAAQLFFQSVPFVRPLVLRAIVYALFALALLRSLLFCSRLNRLFFGVFIIYYFIWTFWSSYDTRNLAQVTAFLVFPLVSGLLNPFFTHEHWGWSLSLSKNKLLATFTLGLVLLLTFLSIKYPEEKIYASQMLQRRQFGYAEINQYLYAEIAKDPHFTFITTNPLHTTIPDMDKQRLIIPFGHSLKKALKTMPRSRYMFITIMQKGTYETELSLLVKEGILVPFKLVNKYDGLYTIHYKQDAIKQ